MFDVLLTVSVCHSIVWGGRRLLLLRLKRLRLPQQEMRQRPQQVQQLLHLQPRLRQLMPLLGLLCMGRMVLC